VLEALGDDEPLTRPLVILGGLVLAGTAISLVHFWLLERTAQRIVLGARRGLPRGCCGCASPTSTGGRPVTSSPARRPTRRCSAR
jgi:hypothetical protein